VTVSSVEKSSKTFHVRWVRSGIGFASKQKRIVRSLGLHRLHQVVELPDTASVRGAVASVAHLVQIVEPLAQLHWISLPEYSIRAPEPSPERPAAESAADEPVQESSAAVEASHPDSPQLLPQPGERGAGQTSAVSESQE
jgi:large subunit ribosomal protein L30